MRRHTAIIFTAAVVVAGVSFAGCEDHAVMPQAHDNNGHSREAFADIDRAVAVVHPTAGNDVTGVVRFEHLGDEQVRVTARFENLEPGGVHGFHVHEFGDCTADDATSAGGHYNPQGHPHGLPNDDERHAGDFGNVTVGEDGVANFELVVQNITVAGERNPVLGRGVIIHTQRDDGSQPLGDAGPRIGCGVIGVAQDQ